MAKTKCETHMRNSYLDYYKLILDKVSFDDNLFMKEYKKALNMLTADEAEALQRWLRSRGHPVHQVTEKKVFQSVFEPSEVNRGVAW